MVETGYAPFNRTVDKTNRVLREIEEASAHVPLLLRGVYFDGWRPSAVPAKADREQFLGRIGAEMASDHNGSLDHDGSTEALVRIVLEVLKSHLSEGEREDMKAGMPKDLVSVLP
jgi:uncharacterized protein (DUF2267 family)